MAKGQIRAGVLASACIIAISTAALTNNSGSETDIVASARADTTGTASGNRAETPESDSVSSNPDQQQSASEGAVDLNPSSLAPAPANFGPAKSLDGLDGWLQTDSTSLGDFDDKVKVLQFWTFSCHNCKATIPSLQHLYETYGDSGFEIIGVHAPEFSFEKDQDAVLAAAQDLGVTWPIAIDNTKTNFRSWQGSRRFWPRTYVIDVNGNIRFDHIGEGAYEDLEDTVRYLMENGGA